MGNLAELADRNADQMMALATPALRAALERHKNQSKKGHNAFNSFINPAT